MWALEVCDLENMDNQLPIEELLYEEESTTLDFKQEQYPFSSANEYQKSEIIKDILSFSNAWRRSDAYILIGVEEVKGGRSKPLGIQDELDDAQLQQLVNSKTQRPINFNYSTVFLDGVKIGIIRIPTQPRPYFLNRNYGKLKKHVVYIRRGSSTDEASPEEIYSMGRAEVSEVEEVPNLRFEFANLDARTALGEENNIEVVLLDVPSLKYIPDYYEEQETGALGIHIPSLSHARSEYYRDLVKYYYVINKSEKLAFLIRNDSNKTVSDIKIEIIIEKQGNKFVFFKDNDFPDFPRSHYDPIANIRPISHQITKNNKPSIKVQDLDDKYRIEVPFEKVQPKQTVFCEDIIFIAANETIEVNSKITIYADNIPVPIESGLSLFCKVKEEPGSLEDIKKMHAKRLLTKNSS